ncbi:general substrate transporter [Sparassis latifolia]
MVQLLNTIGIASGYFISYGTIHRHSSFSWRFPFGVQAVVSAIYAIGSAVLPHSPRWLRCAGRHAEAELTWVKLGVSAADVQKTNDNMQSEHTDNASWWTEAQQLWKKGVRTRTVLGIFLMGMQQASGIDGMSYAPVLFSQAGLPSTTASFVASGVSGIINVVCTFCVQFFADNCSPGGRRTSMIRGGSVIATAMLLIGTLYASHASNTAAGRYSVIVLPYIFVVGFVPSWAIVTRIICSEIQSMRTRAAVTSLGQCANWVGTPIFTPRLSTRVPTSSSGCQLDNRLLNSPFPCAFVLRPLLPLRKLLPSNNTCLPRFPT